MSNVGYIQSKIVADASGSKKGFQEATEHASKFAKDTDSKLKSASSSFQSFMTGALTGSFLSNIPIVGAINDFAKGWRDAKREADSFGATVQELDAIKFFGKDQADDLKDGLGRLQKTIGEAASGSEEAQKKFDKLGMSWQELGAMSPVEQLQAVGDKLKGYNNSIEKNILAHELFGKSGHNLIGTSERSGWEKAQAQAEGYSTTVRKAQESSGKFFSTVKDMWDTGLGKTLSGDVFTHNYLADEKGVGGLLVWAGIMKEIPKREDDVTNAIERQNQAAAENEKRHQARVAAIEALRKASIDEAVGKQTDALQEQINALKMGAEGLARFKLEQQGATKEQIAGVKAMQDMVKDTTDAKKILEDIKTPAQRLNEELSRIAELGSKGMLWHEEEQAAALKAAEKLGLIDKDKDEKSKGIGEAALPGAYSKGSQEALSAINRFQRDGLGLQPDKVDQANKKAEMQREGILQLLRDIKGGGQVKVMNF